MPPPSAPAAPVAPKPPPSVTLVQTVNIENGTTSFNYTTYNNNNGYSNGKPENMVNLGGGILNSGVNFNSGGFNPAQQYTPASEVLPGYQPGNRVLPPQAPRDEVDLPESVIRNQGVSFFLFAGQS